MRKSNGNIFLEKDKEKKNHKPKRQETEAAVKSILPEARLERTHGEIEKYL